jgi:hypothetical protein
MHIKTVQIRGFKAIRELSFTGEFHPGHNVISETMPRRAPNGLLHGYLRAQSPIWRVSCVLAVGANGFGKSTLFDGERCAWESRAKALDDSHRWATAAELTVLRLANTPSFVPSVKQI